MTNDSTTTLTPRRRTQLGAGAVAEPHPGTVIDLQTKIAALYRGARPDYPDWLRHVASAAGCAQPVRLHGRVDKIDTRTGEVTSRSTETMPDGVIYKACGNRRSTVCPSCAEIYRADAYQLVLAGLKGGKNVPESVAGHPAVFATLTAPGFGIVHTQRTTRSGRVIPCRARRKLELCPHGVPMRCARRHKDDDPRLGQPLCPDCYDHPHHAVWNMRASELWRRTSQQARRLLGQHAKQHGDHGRVRLSFGKVAEYQRRGVVHFHALIRLDGIDPNDPERVIPPPEWATVFVLEHLLRSAVESTAFVTKPHPANEAGWPIAWGGQLDIRPLRVRADKTITDTQVAGYCAKYATKSTDATGHVSKRITENSIRIYADDSHPGRIINAAWDLGDAPDYTRLRRWAHMLGFGGHFFTKSNRYSTTFKVLRKVRTDWRRRRHDRPDGQLADQHDEETVLVVNTLDFDGMGWHNPGDALLANTSAALARERRRAKNDVFEAQIS
jgi:hypothetical protein